MKSIGQVVVCAFALATFCVRADVTWTGTAGGCLDDKANWGGTLPGASDMAVIATVQSGDLTLSGETETQNFYRMKFSAPGCNVFDLGSGKSVLVTHRMFFTAATTVWLKSGTFGVADSGDRVFIGDDQNTKAGYSYGGNTLIVDGVGTVFKSAGNAEATESNNYIGLGQNNANNTIVVTNGATLRGMLKIGYNQIYSTNNVLRVTGEGSSFAGVGSKRMFGLGYVGGDNRVEVADGASFETPGRLQIGNAYLVNGVASLGWRTGPRNAFVADGSGTTVTLNGDVFVGYAGSSNRLEVTGGALLSLSSDLYVGYGGESIVNETAGLAPSNACCNVFRIGSGSVLSQASRTNPLNIGYVPGATGNVVRIEGSWSVPSFDEINVGYRGEENELDVNGGRLEIQDAGLINIGSESTSDGNVLRVRAGGVVSRPRIEAASNGTKIQVGRYGKNSKLILDGGSVLLMPKTSDNSTAIVAGATPSASGATIVCTNGSSIWAGRLIVGDMAPGCRMWVENSTVTVSNKFDVGYSAITGNGASYASNCLLRVSGATSAIRDRGSFCLYNDSTLEYIVPDEPVTGPVIAAGGLDLRPWGSGPKLRVRWQSGNSVNQEIELLRTQQKLPADLLEKLTCDVPDNIRVIVTDYSIRLKRSSRGLCVILK